MRLCRECEKRVEKEIERLNGLGEPYKSGSVTILTSESGIYFISKADGEERDSIESVVVSWGSQ